MSNYINMDHAGWVQRQIDATYCSGKPTAAETRASKEHKGWWAAPHQLNPFHVRAFNILGIVGNGIYNAPISWNSLYWDLRQIIVPWRSNNDLGTFDFSGLTRLVFLCHEARIRGYIEPNGPRHLKVVLSERQATGSVTQRHPSLEEALAEWRAEFPADHSIVYRADAK